MSNKNRFGRAAVSLAVAAVAMGGVALGVSAYNSGSSFDPTGADRELNINHVVFPGEEKTTGQSEDGSDNSELWEKDRRAQEQTRPQNNSSAEYLFENRQTVDPDSPEHAALNGQDAQDNTSGGDGVGSARTVYDLTDDAGSADVILSQGDGTGRGTGATGGTGTGNGSVSPTPTARPGSNTGANGSGSDSGTTTPTAKPSVPDVPEQEVPIKDPEINNGTGGDGPFYEKPYDPSYAPEDPDKADTTVTVMVSIPFDASADYLYKGQQIRAIDLFHALVVNVTIRKNDDFAVDSYYMTDEHYNKLFRITGVSFDGGETVRTAFPMTILDDLPDNHLIIYYDYRVKETDSWQSGTEDSGVKGYSYLTKDARLYVLSQKLPNEESFTINKSWILNTESVDSSARYPAEGDIINLYQYQGKLLSGNLDENKHLTKLFLGWTKDDELQPFIYTAQSGRQILEPSDLVDFDTSKYQVELKNYWIDDAYHVGIQYSNYVQLQTLTYYKGCDDYNNDGYYLKDLKVPEAVQAVDFSYNISLNVDSIELPASTFYVNTEGLKSGVFDTQSGLQVNQSYTVAEDNPRYTAKDGILYNKDETEMLGVPVKLEELTIPEAVTSVTLPYNTALKTVELKADSVEELPDVNYERLSKGACIEVPGDFLEDFLLSQADTLSQDDLYVASDGAPNVRYKVVGDFAVTDGGVVYRVLDTTSSWITLPSIVEELDEGSLSLAKNVTTLVMPRENDVIFGTDCFKDHGSLSVILCYTEEQYDAATAAVKAAGAEGEITVVLGTIHTVGEYVYTIDNDGSVMLLEAPKSGLTEFDGTVPAENSGETLPVNVIAEGALADSADLVWVNLPEQTTVIGKQAFKGCYKLQGVLINAKDSITIGKGAFDQCSTLRFVASNAMTGVIEDGTNLALPSTQIKDYNYLFAPTNCEGYTSNWISFVPESDVASYALVDCRGTKVLYGVGAAGDQWLVLRSGTNVSDEVTLPSETVEFFSACFADARTADNSVLTLNWSDLSSVWCFDSAAFQNSDFGGVVTLPEGAALYANAFTSCNKLTEVRLPGEGILVEEFAFSDCANLQKVTFGAFREKGSGLYYGAFSQCESLTDLEFTDSTPPDLLFADFVLSYQFNGSWEDWGDDAEHIHITVPEDSMDAFVEKWRYPFCGYVDGDMATGSGSQSADRNMLDQAVNDLFNWYWTYPTVEQIREYVDDQYIAGTNRLYKMLGIDEELTTVDHPYTLTGGFGDVTLTDIKESDGRLYLDAASLELPRNYELDYIASEAFANAPSVRTVSIVDSLKGIYDNAFEGVQLDPDSIYDSDLTVVYYGATPPQLILEEEGEPFSFGVEDGTFAWMDFWGAYDDFDPSDYINAWTLPMAGYNSLDSMREAVRAQMKEQYIEALGTEPDDVILEWATYYAMQTRLFNAENRVRTILRINGVETITSSDEMLFQLDKPTSTEPELPEITEPETPTPEPDLEPETSDTSNTGDDKDDEDGSEDKDDTEPKNDAEDKSPDDAENSGTTDGETGDKNPDANADGNTDESPDTDNSQDSENPENQESPGESGQTSEGGEGSDSDSEAEERSAAPSDDTNLQTTADAADGQEETEE